MLDLVLRPLRRDRSDMRAFASRVHQDQTDKSGRPYTMHLGRVSDRAWMHALNMKRTRDLGFVVEQIAWLHDVIEDTPYDADHLRREGFSEEVVSGVEWLTKPKSESYADWIARLCADAPLASLIVKLADLEDNSDPERLSKLDEATQARLRKKYDPALLAVRAAVEGRGR